MPRLCPPVAAEISAEVTGPTSRNIAAAHPIATVPRPIGLEAVHAATRLPNVSQARVSKSAAKAGMSPGIWVPVASAIELAARLLQTEAVEPG